MKKKSYRTPAGKLRRAAVLIWLLAGVLAFTAVLSIALWRNPWTVHKIDASHVSVEKLKDIAHSRSPYVEISGIDLTFTGFYEVSGKDTVSSYCYMAPAGDQFILLDLKAEDGGDLAVDSSGDGADKQTAIKDTTIRGRVVVSTDMAKWLAKDESMSVKEYRSTYHIAPVEIRAYHNDQERIRIYQMMLLVMTAGLTAVAAILWSESGIVEREGIL